MMAISAIDVALWDIAAKAVGEPLYRLLGGSCRTELPVYASMFVHLVEPEAVAQRAATFANRGYPAQK